MVGLLTGFASDWLAKSSMNKMAKSQGNKSLDIAANGTFNAFKHGLADVWQSNSGAAMDSREAKLAPAAQRQFRHLMSKKKKLHIALAENVTPTPSPTLEQAGPKGREMRVRPTPILPNAGRLNCRGKGQ